MPAPILVEKNGETFYHAVLQSPDRGEDKSLRIFVDLARVYGDENDHNPCIDRYCSLEI
jgi:hypothetical protein